MISALTPLVRTRDSAGSLPPTTLPASAPWRSGKVPSVLLIQRALEEAWSCGFDPESTWIGAIDAAALLRFWGIEARLVDSDPRQSAQRCGPHPAILAWIWDYFEKRCVRASGCVACRIDAATEPASRGDTEVERATTMTGKGREPIPPLFLQYAGHSMTVIGAELNTALEEVQLVILDPNRRRHAGRLHLDLRSLWDLQAPQYQVLYVAESIFWDERTPIAYRQTLTSSRLA
ncbi:hypothetical protein F1559_004068 [Cyanidiococcus yangmingshanensis]|uniref:UFSP1/2/DUB catalytic domain-containing protein n=1 Tax=Cyanidiococcus yangmingshanensis TaxID=2690220 RepID=A0A7J7IN48_9RHOD|nr:hypothetical protein F1559_004068 [Cyanidiococcus yangmingshanensis]